MDNGLVGSIATVTAEVPAGGQGYGEVVVEVRGGTAAYNAVTAGSDTDSIPPRTKAIVVDELPGGILIVSSSP